MKSAGRISRILPLCLIILLLASGAVQAGTETVWSASEDPSLFGHLDQQNSTVTGAFDGHGCSVTSVVNSLVYLQRQYSSIYGTNFIGDYNTQTLANVAVTLGTTPSYLNFNNGGVSWNNYYQGTENYIEAKVPNRTGYSGEVFSGSGYPSWVGVYANTTGNNLTTNPSYPTWQYIYNNLHEGKAVLIHWSATGSYDHYMTVTGIYVDDKNGDGWLKYGTDVATISYIDPEGGQAYTANIWQRGTGTTYPDGGLVIDYGETSSGYPSGWWYYGNAHINLAMAFGPEAAVPLPSTLLLLGSGLVGLAGLRRRLRKP